MSGSNPWKLPVEGSAYIRATPFPEGHSRYGVGDARDSGSGTNLERSRAMQLTGIHHLTAVEGGMSIVDGLARWNLWHDTSWRVGESRAIATLSNSITTVRKSCPASNIFAGVPRIRLRPPAARIAGPAISAYAARASGSLIER